MTYVMIWLSGGIIEQVTFFDSKLQALKTLADFVKGMDLHDDDAAVFGPEGLVANAKDFLDENNEFIEDSDLINRAGIWQRKTQQYLYHRKPSPLVRFHGGLL